MMNKSKQPSTEAKTNSETWINISNYHNGKSLHLNSISRADCRTWLTKTDHLKWFWFLWWLDKENAKAKITKNKNMPQNYKCVNNTLELSHRRVSFELSLPLTAELFQQWTSSPSSLLYSASQVLVDPCMHYVRYVQRTYVHSALYWLSCIAVHLCKTMRILQEIKPLIFESVASFAFAAALLQDKSRHAKIAKAQAAFRKSFFEKKTRQCLWKR